MVKIVGILEDDSLAAEAFETMINQLPQPHSSNPRHRRNVAVSSGLPSPRGLTQHLKTTMKMGCLKSRTAEGIIKELMIFVLVYNLIRAAILAAAERQKVGVNRISFVNAQRWLCSILRKVAKGVEVELIVNPIREERWEPRVLKRRMKPYDLMTRPRGEYAEPAMAEEVMA